VCLKSPVRENRTPGSVRGQLGNWPSYPDGGEAAHLKGGRDGYKCIDRWENLRLCEAVRGGFYRRRSSLRGPVCSTRWEWVKVAKWEVGLTVTTEKPAGPRTARTTISGSAYTGCRPLSTLDRTANSLSRPCAINIVRRAASSNPYAAQPALPADCPSRRNQELLSRGHRCSGRAPLVASWSAADTHVGRRE